MAASEEPSAVPLVDIRSPGKASKEEGDPTPKEIIENIRQDEYMLGLDLSEKAQRAAKNLWRKLDGALRLLSQDLYSTDTHFILELIQNADDNGYGPGVVPEVAIRLSPTRLQVANNELGFTESNVRALCSVGESTKAKKSGFIGEKGIGFKSVFTVSDIPEVHSNGFHFRFDRSSPEELLGYVVPHWCDPDATISKGLTTIVLPAKRGHAFAEADLAELDPKLLLFLRKLRRIELQHPSGTITYSRSDEPMSVVISTQSKTEQGDSPVSRARYVSVGHFVSTKHVTEEKRPGIGETELVLAYPVDDMGKALAEPNRQTFAFLPIRSFGFRFFIQGDFLLSSSREDIQAGRAWNVALRDNIAGAFVAGIDSLRSIPELALTYLNFVPQDDEISNPFFRPVVGQIIDRLSRTNCIPGATGEWRRPSEIMTAPAEFQRLVPPEAALKLFGKDYASPDLAVDHATLKRVGCSFLTVPDLVQMFATHGDWLLARSKAWLADFYVFLAGLVRKPLLDAKLGQAPCILNSAGTLSSPHSVSVFYPLARGKKFGFESELIIIDEEVLDAAVERSEKVRPFLDELGVKTPEPFELISKHILPRHKGEAWTASSFPALIGHVRYVKGQAPGVHRRQRRPGRC